MLNSSFTYAAEFNIAVSSNKHTHDINIPWFNLLHNKLHEKLHKKLHEKLHEKFHEKLQVQKVQSYVLKHMHVINIPGFKLLHEKLHEKIHFEPYVCYE